MKSHNLTYKLFGESAILIEWPAKIDENIILDIVSFESIVSKTLDVMDTIIAYNSLTVCFKNRIEFNYEVSQLKEIYETKREAKKQEVKLWKIPVCYDVAFGLDLEEIANEINCSVDEVIRLHSAPTYLIYFLGFQPGFLYLGGLNEMIHRPRRANPRIRVAKGSVGIGGAQTGIYPQNSSGGWNLIGKSPIDFFDASKESPCFANPGDRIQFYSIDLKTYQSIAKEVNSKVYELKSARI